MERKTSILWFPGEAKIAVSISEAERAIAHESPHKQDNLLESQDGQVEQPEPEEELRQRDKRFQDIGAQALDRGTEIIPLLKPASSEDC